ncbi:unnamed protein product [Coregonus sp. 'balchen']|nr:unnamed protein product [Coregonus sp. 'balchen']
MAELNAALSTGEKALQLSLMATRKCYRNCGVGRYIIEVGWGWGMWSSVQAISMNQALPCPLSSRSPESESLNPGFSLMLPELELEVEMARTKALAAYQQQAVCVTRLVREVKTLREQLELQRREVDNLNNELDKERERRHRVEQQFLEYKLRKK